MSGTRFPMNVRQLRVVQIGCLILAASAFWLAAHTGEPRTNTEFGPLQWAIVLAAVYCAVSGFTFQSFFNKKRPRSRPGGTGSTPYHRWGLGHLMRLATACTVALWGARHPYPQRALMDGLWVLRTGNPPGVGVDAGHSSARRSSRNRLTIEGRKARIFSRYN